MPACQGPQATVPDADVDSAASFLGYLYIVSQYTVRLMTPCVWRIFCLRNSSCVPYFRQPPCTVYQLQNAETVSAPNVVRLLSAETECPPKVPICPHSAPKPKPKFGRPHRHIDIHKSRSFTPIRSCARYKQQNPPRTNLNRPSRRSRTRHRQLAPVTQLVE